MIRRSAKAKGWLTAIVLAGSAAGSAQAGRIVAGHAADISAGTFNVGSPATIGANPDLNNDVTSSGSDPADSNNSVNFKLTWTATDPITAAFDVDNSEGVTEYGFNIDFENKSGIDWTGLIVELGHLDGDGGFTPGTFNNLDFDKSAGDAADVMPWYLLDGPHFFFYLPPSVSPQTHTLDTVAIDATQFPIFGGDLIRTDQPGGSTFDHFLGVALDVPDDPGLATWQQGEADYQFALHFTPVPTPEPGSAVLLGGAAAALLLRRTQR
ncbi:MAG: PEP-CTERM sorting domain-containing protein [Planctomycetes bacterium]|nr:PEP-CTERM sorting domain-containing protein [Planctomycetota bacterium]